KAATAAVLAVPAKVPGNGDPGAVPAKLLDIGGLDSKSGGRLFITVLVHGQTSTKLFGNPKQLGDQLTAAGFPTQAQQVQEGITLNLPCRVTTKPSTDGKYLNVERVLPPLPASAGG